MARSKLTVASAAGAVPDWRIPKVLLLAAFRSSSWFGHDLIHRFRTERFEIFLAGLFAMWSGVGVILPLIEYLWLIRSAWMLVFIAIGCAQCTVLVFALTLARDNEFEESATLVCVGSWLAAIGVTVVSPPLLPVMALVALVPVAFAETYVRFSRGLALTLIGACSVLAMAVVARFMPLTDAVAHAPHWLETTFIVVALPFNALHLMIIVWNNAAALRTSEAQLSERAAELAASRTRLITAADEERRRLERDLHDGAQQHLVALSVLIRLARDAEADKYHALLTEASCLVGSAVDEIRRLAQGIYPPLLVSGGLTQALPGLAHHAIVPVHLDLCGVGRYATSTEAALYYCCSEALQNAAKHGGPGTEVTVTARDDGLLLTLEIRDGGSGFDPGTIGMGLTNMTDRMSAIDGALVIDTAPGRGTRIVATVETSPTL